MRGSFCLVRLLKVFKPVSNPSGLIHVFPETPQQDPLSLLVTALTDRPALRTPWKTCAFPNTDLTECLHIVTLTQYEGSERTASLA